VPRPMRSCVYNGWVRHRRLAPTEHEFRYRLFMMFLDLGELPALFDRYWLWSGRRPAPAWFRRSDYLGPAAVPLDRAVRDEIERQTGRRPDGPVRVLTHLRYFGYSFNPVTFYYCYDARGERVEYVVAEITNTPWGERHAYALAADASISGGADLLRFRFGKAFHVSPFLPMDMDYDWRFTQPGERLVVHMRNERAGAGVFDATLSLAREPLSHASLAAVLARHPVMTAAVTMAIYWQAVRLWLKRTPFHTHPDKLAAPAARPRKP
jgi:uncharacterized protein